MTDPKAWIIAGFQSLLSNLIASRKSEHFSVYKCTTNWLFSAFFSSLVKKKGVRNGKVEFKPVFNQVFFIDVIYLFFFSAPFVFFFFIKKASKLCYDWLFSFIVWYKIPNLTCLHFSVITFLTLYLHQFSALVQIMHFFGAFWENLQ